MKRSIILLLFALVLCSCTDQMSEPKNEKTICGEMPVITVSDQQKEENMLWYASFTAANNYLNTVRTKYDKAYIGDRVPVYVVDETGTLRDMGSPFFYPIILDELPYGYVSVYSGADDLYTPGYYGGPNPWNISDTQMYALCSDSGIHTLQTDYDDQKNGRTYEFVENLNKKFAILMENGEKRLIITEDSVYDFQERKKTDSADEYITAVREMVRNSSEYQLHELPSEMAYENKTVWYVENILSDSDNDANVKKVSEFVNELPDFKGEEKRVKISDRVNSWYVIVNADLSRTVVSDINPAYYLILINGVFSGVSISVMSDNDGIHCPWSSSSFPLLNENWKSVKKTDYIVLRDNMFSYQNSLIITSDETIYPQLRIGETGSVPELYADIVDHMKMYLEK